MNTYAIIIPSYNEDTISDIASEITLKYSFPLIIVDDGSDKPISFESTGLSKVIILRNKENKGKGYSILKGIKKSISLKCSHSIVLDADYQHCPNDIKSFVSNEDCGLVLGYRFFKSPMPFSRILSNKVTSFIISFLSKQNIKDSQCGFRAYKNAIFNDLIFKENGFQFESEILLKMARNLKVKQIPVKTIYNENKSHINKTKDTLKFIKLIIRHLIYGK